MHSMTRISLSLARLPGSGQTFVRKTHRRDKPQLVPSVKHRSGWYYCTTILSGRLCTTFTVVFDCELVKTAAVPVTITV
jgi:hypothetical protein